MFNLHNRGAEVLDMVNNGLSVNQAIFELSMEQMDFHDIDYGQGDTWNLQDSDQEPDMMDNVREDVSKEGQDIFLNKIDMDKELFSIGHRRHGPQAPNVAYVGPYYLTESGHWIHKITGQIVR